MKRLLVLVALTGAVVGSGMCDRPHAFADAPVTGATPATTTTPTVAQIIATARQYLGFPYAYIGDQPSKGFSCIGLIHFVFAQNGVYVPEDLGKAYASAPHVQQSNLQPGDLVFFKDTVWKGISHVALYVGAGMMIAADSFKTGVEWDSLSDSYWQRHYLGATRPLSDPSGTPVTQSEPPPPSGPSLAPQTQGQPNLALKAGTTLEASHAATIYSGPGVTYITIATVTPAVSLTVEQTQGQWVNVAYDGGGQYGWVRGPDLNLASQTTAGSTQSSTGGAGAIVVSGPIHQVASARRAHAQAAIGSILVVTAAVLYVRDAPGEQGAILRRVHAGDRLRLLSTGNGWDYVALRDGSRGWVSAAWVQ